MTKSIKTINDFLFLEWGITPAGAGLRPVPTSIYSNSSPFSFTCLGTDYESTPAGRFIC